MLTEGTSQEFMDTCRACNLIVFMLDALDGEEVLQSELELGKVLCPGVRADYPKTSVDEPMFIETLF